MPRVLIIGCGNPLRGDDGVAWRVAEELARASMEDIEVVAQHQLTPELAFAISRAEAVLFVDADAAASAGEIRCQEVTPRPSAVSLSHELSAAGLLSLSQKLYGKQPRASMISIGGETFAHSESLSPKVEAALPRVLRMVNGFIKKEAAIS